VNSADEGVETTKSPIGDSSGNEYFNRYDNVETAITESTKPPESAAKSETYKENGESGYSVASAPGSEVRQADQIGLTEYIEDTVRNLWQLAYRSGMEKSHFEKLINNAMK
jgi:hypothetical protein